MQGTELFLSLAEIAGVFVGFGALISIRSGGTNEAHEVTYIRSVVSLGIWVVVVALAPVIISQYGLGTHELWLVCSLLGLVLYVGMWIVNERTTESRELGTSYSRAEMVGVVASNLAFTGLMVATLVVIVLGLFPNQERALYLSAVALVLSLGAFTLLLLVLSRRRTPVASDAADLLATGGSIA